MNPFGPFGFFSSGLQVLCQLKAEVRLAAEKLYLFIPPWWDAEIILQIALPKLNGSSGHRRVMTAVKVGRRRAAVLCRAMGANLETDWGELLKKCRSLNAIPSWSDRLDGGTDIGFVVTKELGRGGSKWMKRRERKGCDVVWVNVIGRCYMNGLVAGTRRTERVPCRPRLLLCGLLVQLCGVGQWRSLQAWCLHRLDWVLGHSV